MQSKEYTAYSKEEFLKIYRDATCDKGLLTVLVEMQTQTGVNEQKAYEVANALIGQVARFECTKDRMLEEPEAVINDFFKTARKLQGYDRKVVLHQIDFGLGLYLDSALLEQMKEGATADTLFRTYYSAYGEDPALTEAVLEDRIRKKMAGFALSPEVLRAMAKKLEKSDHVMLTCAALGEDNLRIKCIAAMEQYLSSQGTMTIAGAANAACIRVEAEGVTDAVSRGRLAAETAGKILLAVSLTAFVVGMLSIFSVHLIPGAVETIMANSGWSVLNSAFGFAALSDGITLMELGVGTGAVVLKKQLIDMGALLLFGSMGGTMLSDRIAAWIGRIAAKRQYFNRSSAEVMEGLNIMANTARTREPVSYWHEEKTNAVLDQALAENTQMTTF